MITIAHANSVACPSCSSSSSRSGSIISVIIIIVGIVFSDVSSFVRNDSGADEIFLNLVLERSSHFGAELGQFILNRALCSLENRRHRFRKNFVRRQPVGVLRGGGKVVLPHSVEEKCRAAHCPFDDRESAFLVFPAREEPEVRNGQLREKSVIDFIFFNIERTADEERPFFRLLQTAGAEINDTGLHGVRGRGISSDLLEVGIVGEIVLALVLHAECGRFLLQKRHDEVGAAKRTWASRARACVVDDERAGVFVSELLLVRLLHESARVCPDVVVPVVWRAGRSEKSASERTRIRLVILQKV